MARAARVVRDMVTIKINNTELALFLASTMGGGGRWNIVERSGLGEVVHTRLHTTGATPGITSREILSRGPACPTKWRPPVREPTEVESRRMLGLMLEYSINFCMHRHYYMVEGQVRRQTQGAGIGLRLSEALGRAFGLHLDRKLIQKLRRLNWAPEMIQRYVDDLNTVVVGLKAGTRYNVLEEKLEVVAGEVEGDQGREVDDITMTVFGEVANTVDPDIEVEVDFPSKHDDKMMPILDMQMAVRKNKVVYQFFKKPMANQFTMLARSALPDQVKRSTLTNDAMRRLLCCSPDLKEQERVEVMEEYTRTLQRSGYSQKFRHEVIADAVQGHANMVRREEEGGRPVDRPREYEEVERRRKKERKRSHWYRKEVGGSRVREGVIIVPPTPGSVLAKELQKVCKEELSHSNMSMHITERGGTIHGQVLGTKTPGASRREHCGREKCFTCNTGQEGVCRRTGLGYEITCIVCGNISVVSKYAGETGRNTFMRGEDYVRDLEKKAKDKPLWKHISEKHEGRMVGTMFEHFTMKVTKVFYKPQRRIANEGVRIVHLNPETRMNSKDEFRQGTNVMMRPTRGVGD